MRISIIGTAGRGEAAKFINHDLFLAVQEHAMKQIHMIKNNGPTIVSGGAAVIDHIAVTLFLDGKIDDLELFLPCEFRDGKYVESGFKSPGSIANYYHRKFSDSTGINSLEDISKAIDFGAKISVINGGFHARNISVGKSDAIIAYTFGEGNYPADGGTKHCWDNSKAGTKLHFSLNRFLERLSRD